MPNPDAPLPAHAPLATTPGGARAETVRTRFAPSPTGYLHVGGARTAVLNWLVARHHGGTFVLRIEDTDTDRNLAGAEQQIFDELNWLGLTWDEGPDVGGPYGPYRQSERGPLYSAAADRLLATGRAYWCTCPPSDDADAEWRRRCACALPEQTPRQAEGASLRFRVPDRDPVVVEDEVRGRVTFPADSVEDFVLLRSDGRPTYNFAAVVDDAAMHITHVVRGADHLINTPKQMLLYEALGEPVPRFAHIPLILGPDRKKLSKRHGAVSVGEYQRTGVLPEALINYLSLLSWSAASGEEVLPLDRLVAEVDLARVGASDAVFDEEKLHWLSSVYLQRLTPEQLERALEPFVDWQRFPIPRERFGAVAGVLRERIATLSQANEHLHHFVGPVTEAQQRARADLLAGGEADAVLRAVRQALVNVEPWEPAVIGVAVRQAGKVAGARGRALFHPVRIALTGEEHGPDLGHVVFALGRDRARALLAGD